MDRYDRLLAAQEFLDSLWGDVSDENRICLMTLMEPPPVHHLFADTDSAAEFCADSEVNTYVACGLSPHDPQRKSRALATEVTAIAGVWADVDYESPGAHKSTKVKGRKPLPPDEEAAMKIIEAVPFAPTLIVHSGHGLQPWWLFKEPLEFESDADRLSAANLSTRWQSMVIAIADRDGYFIDRTSDLARVLRVPGTYNCKTDDRRLVRLIKKDGPRFTELFDAEEAIPDGVDDGGTGLSIPHETDKLKAKSVSHYVEIAQGVSEGSRNNDLTSLTGMILLNIVDPFDKKMTAVTHQLVQAVNERCTPKLDPKEVTTLFMSVLRAEQRRRTELFESEQFKKQYTELVANDGNAEAMIQKVREQLGFDFAYVVKVGRENSDYMFYTRGGEPIGVGTMLNQGRVRQQIRDATRGDAVINQFTKKDWDNVCGRIAVIAQEQRIPDEEILMRNDDVVESYLSDVGCYGSEEWQEAILDSRPFKRNGMVHVNISNIESFLNQKRYKMRGQREVGLGLRLAGWKVTPVSARVKGKPVSRRYWAKAEDDIGFQVSQMGTRIDLTTPDSGQSDSSDADDVISGDYNSEDVNGEDFT